MQKNTANYEEIKGYFQKKIRELGLENPLIFFDDQALRIDIGYGPKEFQLLFKDFIAPGGIYQQHIMKKQSFLGKSPEEIFVDSCMTQDYKVSLNNEEKRGNKPTSPL